MVTWDVPTAPGPANLPGRSPSRTRCKPRDAQRASDARPPTPTTTAAGHRVVSSSPRARVRRCPVCRRPPHVAEHRKVNTLADSGPCRRSGHLETGAGAATGWPADPTCHPLRQPARPGGYLADHHLQVADNHSPPVQGASASSAARRQPPIRVEGTAACPWLRERHLLIACFRWADFSAVNPRLPTTSISPTTSPRAASPTPRRGSAPSFTGRGRGARAQADGSPFSATRRVARPSARSSARRPTKGAGY